MRRRSTSPRVVVDAMSATGQGGIAYLAGLLPHLAQQPGIGSVVAIVEPAAVLTDLLTGTGVEVYEQPLGNGGLVRRLLWEVGGLSAQTAGTIVLTPSGILPRRLASPIIAVPQNILPFVAGGTRNRLQRAAIVRTLGFAAGASFVSDVLRQEVKKFAHLPACQRVISPGLDEAFRGPSDRGQRRAGIVAVLNDLPHKRVDLLISAWRMLGRDRPPLRLIGVSPRPGAPGKTLSFDAVLGPIEIASALRSAELAVFPSAAESVGLPALEALACDTPLVVSDIRSLRDATDGHAVFVRGDAAVAWADAIGATLASPPPTELGREWALQFTWEKAARQTADLVNDVHEAGARCRNRTC